MALSIVGTQEQSPLNVDRRVKLSSDTVEMSKWYVAYTSSNHEKCVASNLTQRSIQHFLPLYDSVHRWKDRKVKLQLPLFPGYVFVRMALRDRLQVLQAPGIVRLVGFDGQPCPVPDSEMEALHACLAQNITLEPHRYIEVGRRVRIKAGPLEGLEGIVIRKKNRLHFLISLNLIHCSAAVKVGAAEIEPSNLESVFLLERPHREHHRSTAKHAE